jgi:hypothetical protein
MRFFICGFVVIVFSQGLFSAEISELEVVDHYRPIIERYYREATETATRVRALNNKISDHNGPIPESSLLETVNGAIASLKSGLDALDRDRQRHDKREISLAACINSAESCMFEALKTVWKAYIDETKWRVMELSQRQSAQARKLSDEYETACATIDAQMKGDEATAAKQRVRTEKLVTQRAAIDQILKEYKTITAEILRHHRDLCGDTWMLQDFNDRRERKSSADQFFSSVYTLFCDNLAGRGVEFHKKLFGYWSSRKSELDFFIYFPGSPDRIILNAYFGDNIEILHKMDEAFAAQPVESLRKYNNSLPPINAPGSQLEQLCYILEKRSVRLFTLEAKQAALFQDLKQLVPEGPVLILPRIDGLNAAFDSVFPQMREVYVDGETRAEADRALLKAEEAIAKAERELSAAAGKLLFSRDLKSVPAGTRNAVNPKILVDELSREIAGWQKLIDDPQTSDEQRKNLREKTLPRLRAKLATIQTAIERELGEFNRAVQKATADRDAARELIKKLPKPLNPDAYRNVYRDAKKRYDEAVRSLPEELRAGLQQLPVNAEEASPAIINAALKALQERIGQANDQRLAARVSITQKLGEIERIESESVLLAKAITELRIAGAIAVENTLGELGAKATDDVTEELKTLKKDLDEGKELLTKADKRLDKLEKIRAKLVGAGAGADIIKSTRERLGTITKALEYVSTAAERVATLRTFNEQLGDERTALKAISTLLDGLGSTAEKVPVIGQTLGRFLSFYSKGATACCEAAVQLQDKLIERNLKTNFNSPAPERHLYTLESIESSGVEGNEGARKRIAAMLQVRRMLYLVNANTPEAARDMTR